MKLIRIIRLTPSTRLGRRDVHKVLFQIFLRLAKGFNNITCYGLIGVKSGSLQNLPTTRIQ